MCFREGAETGGLRSDINECELDQPCANGAACVESSCTQVGLGRIVALHHRSSTLYQMH
jgi:hypothetical protein